MSWARQIFSLGEDVEFSYFHRWGKEGEGAGSLEGPTMIQSQIWAF